jgi:hypothetical protein
LHADFQWLADGRKEGLYFPPVPAPASAPRDAEPSKKITLC